MESKLLDKGMDVTMSVNEWQDKDEEGQLSYLDQQKAGCCREPGSPTHINDEEQ